MLEAIERIKNEEQKLAEEQALVDNKLARKLIALNSRRIGIKLVRCGTPLEKMDKDVQSPRTR